MSGQEEPRRVEINLGLLCNNKCVFCMSSDLRDAKSPWAPLETVKAELAHFYENGCRSLGFLGGEPTVYPHLIECVAFAKRLGYVRIALCTNGTRLSDPLFCRRLVLEGVSRVAISVHSHRPEIEDELITGVPGNLARKIAAIGNLSALARQGHLPHNLSLNPVLNRRNYRELAEYILFFRGLSIRDIRFNFIWPEGAAKQDTSWIPTFREAIPEIVRVLLLNEKDLSMRLTFGGIPKCVLRFAGISRHLSDYLAQKYLDELAYDPPNDVSLASRGPGYHQRFVWQQRKKDSLKMLGPNCRSCRCQIGCEGVWKTYGKLYGLDELRPIS